MLVGLFFFYRGLNTNVFGDNGKLPNPSLYDKKFIGLNKGQIIGLLSFLSVPLFALILKYNQYEHYIVWIATVVITAALVYIYRSIEPEARGKLLVAVYFTVLMSLFWAIFEQAGSSLTLFADRNINLIGINAAQTNSINSTFIILLAVPFSWLWSYLFQKRTQSKFSH